MLSEFVTLEVVLEIRGSKPTPIDHGSFYRTAVFSEFFVGPTLALSRGDRDLIGADGSSACWAALQIGGWPPRLECQNPIISICLGVALTR